MGGRRRAGVEPPPASAEREDGGTAPADSPPIRTAPIRARRIRRGFPIHAYIGANGGGKSMAAVYDTLPSLAAGRPVLSTVRFLDPATGEPHPLWVPLTDYRTLLDAEFCDVILDEVTGVASSRESAGMPPAVANMLVQLRRRDAALRWTAPSWKRADTVIRECSQGVTLCMGFIPERVEQAPRTYDGPHGLCRVVGVHEHDDERLWKSRRLFYWRTYDAATFDEWTTYKKERIKPVARQLFWRPGAVAERAYDTFDSVLALGAVTEAGTCLECGGHRRREACTCERPAPPRKRSRRVAIPETDDTPGLLVEIPGDPAA